MKEAARKELEDWYKHHKEAIEKTRSANRFVLFLYTYFSCLSNALSISSFNATYNLSGRQPCKFCHMQGFLFAVGCIKFIKLICFAELQRKSWSVHRRRWSLARNGKGSLNFVILTRRRVVTIKMYLVCVPLFYNWSKIRRSLPLGTRRFHYFLYHSLSVLFKNLEVHLFHLQQWMS